MNYIAAVEISQTGLIALGWGENMDIIKKTFSFVMTSSPYLPNAQKERRLLCFVCCLV